MKPNAHRARDVTSPLRFMAAESARRGVGEYEARRPSGARFAMRHGTLDVFTFDEVFRERIYAEPEPVAGALRALGRPPEVADLGANVGMFAAWTAAVHPGARITCVEPDPDNLAVLRRTAALNGGAWDVWAAAAATADGRLSFVPGGQATSHVAAPGEAGAVDVAARDVLGLLERSDLVKIDVEGAEWPLLADPRLARSRAVALALEFHPEGCPAEDPRARAHELLGAAGFRCVDVPTPSPPGYGSLWAWRA